jgi:hypothetical protein
MANAESSQLDAVVDSTTWDQKRSWTRWCAYLQEVGITEPFLADFDMCERHRLLGFFASAVREGRFSSDRHPQLAANTVRSTVDHVIQTFKEHAIPDPRYDAGQKMAFVLQRQYKGYNNADPGENQQKALTASIIRKPALLA